MKTVPLAEFRRKYSRLFKHVNKTLETIQVTRFGRPFVDIKPPGLSAEERAARNARDFEILNKHAEKLNRDALDGIEYQAPLGEFPED